MGRVYRQKMNSSVTTLQNKTRAFSNGQTLLKHGQILLGFTLIRKEDNLHLFGARRLNACVNVQNSQNHVQGLAGYTNTLETPGNRYLARTLAALRFLRPRL